MLSMLPCVTRAITRLTSSNKPFSRLIVRILIVSSKFAGKLPVQRHRMVYALLDDEFKNGLHAVNIFTKTPEEYSQ